MGRTKHVINVVEGTITEVELTQEEIDELDARSAQNKIQEDARIAEEARVQKAADYLSDEMSGGVYKQAFDSIDSWDSLTAAQRALLKGLVRTCVAQNILLREVIEKVDLDIFA